MSNLTTEELRQLTKDTVARLTDQECAELLEWVKKESPELDDTGLQSSLSGGLSRETI